MAQSIAVMGTGYVGLIQAVARSVAEHATGFTVVVTKSTVRVGTNRWIADELARCGDCH